MGIIVKYIITETQANKFIRKYLNSLELKVIHGNDGNIWVEDNEGEAIFHYWIETAKTYLLIDPHIWGSVRGLFGLDDMSARYEILLWFEDKFDRRVDDVSIWWD